MTRSHPNGVRRSAQLLQAFRVEQTDPAHFYGLLARDSAQMIAEHASLDGATLVDVGAGPPQFAAQFAAAGARYVAVDRDRAALGAAQEGSRTAGARRLGVDRPGNVVLGDALALPLADGVADIAFSSNVIEHVAQPWVLGDELVRVTRPGGLTVLCYTNWSSPWGGHETSPWHYLGGYVAADRYGRRYGHPPKNRYGVDLFPVSVAAGLRWARRHPQARLVSARPRYLPRWCAPIVHVAGLREVVTWNLWLVLRRC